MMRRPTSGHDRMALKAAFRRLLRACGGQEEAAKATRVGRQSLSRYANPGHPDEHVPIDVLMDLTIDADDPEAVRALCALANGTFAPLPPPGLKPPDWLPALGVAARGGGEAAEAILKALSDDGEVTPEEVRDLAILDRLDAAIEALAVLRRHARGVMEGGP